mgnify:CR=1 FL=1
MGESHSRAVLSQEPVSTRRPSGLKATDKTGAKGSTPLRRRVSFEGRGCSAGFSKGEVLSEGRGFSKGGFFGVFF